MVGLMKPDRVRITNFPAYCIFHRLGVGKVCHILAFGKRSIL